MFFGKFIFYFIQQFDVASRGYTAAWEIWFNGRKKYQPGNNFFLCI